MLSSAKLHISQFSCMRKTLSECIELEGNLYNRRITKFMEICDSDVDSRELREGMKTDFEFSNTIQNMLLFKKLDCCHSKRKKIKENSACGNCSDKRRSKLW